MAISRIYYSCGHRVVLGMEKRRRCGEENGLDLSASRKMEENMMHTLTVVAWAMTLAGVVHVLLQWVAWGFGQIWIAP